MSKLREYKKQKENRDIFDFQKKIVHHRLRNFYRFLLVVLLIVGAGSLVVLQIKNRVYGQYEEIQSIDRKEVSNSVATAFGTSILTYSKDGANCTDASGTVVWNQTYEMQMPLMDMCNEIVALGDYNGHIIYIMNAKQIIGEVDTKMPIRSFSVSESGVVAAILDDANTTWISLFDSSGNPLVQFKTTMNISGYPIALDISPNGEKVAVSYLYLDSGTLLSKVAFHNFGPVGQSKIDKLVSAYSYSGAIVPVVKFINEEISFGVADNRLVIYEGNQIPTSIQDVMLTDQVQSVYYSSQYVGLVYHNVTGESKYKMDIYNTDGKLSHSQNFDIDYKDIFWKDDNLIIYNETECAIYSKKGVEKFRGEFDEQVLSMVPTKQFNKFLLVTTDKIKTIELK